MECEESECVEIIRQRSRDSHQALRVKRRSLVRDGHRSRLQDVEKNLKAPSPQEFSELCQQLKKHKRMEILQRLKLGLGSSQSYRDLFLQCSGAMYALTGCLTGHDGNLQREAACSLINLGLGNNQQCMEVCRSVGVYLVTHLAGNNPDMQDPCAWCVGNLCGSHERVCTMLRTQGVEESLINLLLSHSPHVIQSTTYAILHYLSTVPTRIQAMVDGGVVGRLVKCLGRVVDDGSTSGGVVEVGWCLFLLSTQPSLCPRLLDHGIIGAVFTALDHLINEQNVSVGAVTPLVRTLMNCAAAAPGAAVQMCYRSEQLVGVIKSLLYSPSPHVRSETLHLLASVINAASAESETGKCLVSDLSLRPRLEGAVRSALAARFTQPTPVTPPQEQGLKDKLFFKCE